MRAVISRPQRYALLARGRMSGGSGSGGGASITGSTSDSGHKIIIPLPAGFLAANQSIVNPALVTIEVDTPSVDATAANNTVTRTRRVGYRADVNGTNLEIWMAQPIPAVATAVRMTASSGAITNGASSSLPFTATVTNIADENPTIIAHMLRFVDNAGNYGVAHSVMSNPFWIEGYAVHESGVACVKFEVVGSVTRTSYAIIETRSRYRDSEIISAAQWTKNGGGGAGTQGGIGVYSSAQINPADFTDGVATVTMTSYARIGGAAVSRSQTWNVVMNAGGTYQQRIRFVDSVAGNDTWDGTSQTFVSGLIGPKATLQAAVLAAGAVTGGASVTSIAIVRCVGSGDTNNPRMYQIYTGSGSGNAIAGSTHTWLTIEPAPGFTGADTQVCNYSTVSGLAPRIRRLRIRNMWWDIANLAGPTGTSSSSLISAQTTVFPPATDPEALWLDGVESYHHLGRIGQVTEGNSGNMVSTLYNKNHLTFFTGFVARDMARRGFQVSAFNVTWNARFERIFKDVAKEPDCMVATVWRDNAVPTEYLPITSLTGTPTAGDTITGVYSTGSETVASYTAPNVQLNPGGNSYTFKADDSKQTRRVTVTGVTGTFSAGQVATLGGTANVTIGRVEGNDIYLRSIASVTNGQTIVTATGSATMSSNALAECLLFSPSGARARAAPPHPDGLQVQTFTNQRIYFTGASGAFQVGENVTATNLITPTVVTVVGADFIEVSGSHLKFFNPATPVANGATITGSTSLVTATYVQARSRFISNDKNSLIYCLLGENIDGQPLFGENGSRGIALVNISISGTLGDGSLQTQFSSIPDAIMLHITHPNKRIAIRDVSGMTVNGRVRSAVRWCVAESFGVDGAPQGGAGVDAWQPASDIAGCHALNPTPAASEFDIGMTRGSAQWTNGIGLLEDYDAARKTFQPGASSPVKSKVPAGQREVRYDLFGNERLDNGTASAGAAEEWGV